MKMTKHDAKELKIIQIGLVMLLVIACGVTAWFAWGPPAQERHISSFEECMRHRKEVLDSYPAVCVTKDGRQFTDPNYDHCAVKPDPPPNCDPKTGNSRQ